MENDRYNKLDIQIKDNKAIQQLGGKTQSNNFYKKKYLKYKNKYIKLKTLNNN